VKHIYTTCGLLLLSIISQASTPSKADKLFEKNDFFRASELYKKSAAKHPSQELNFKLGQCYQNMNRYTDAEMSYSKVAAAGPYSNAVFYLDYGLVLKNNSKCEEAKAAFRKYDSLMPNDKRGKLYMNSCAVLAEDHKYDLPVTIANVKSLNTKYSDFGAVRYKDGVVFTSSRRSPTLLDRQIDGWTGGFYTDVYYAKKGQKATDFGKASRLEENMVDLPFHDGSATFSRNFDTIYISRVMYDLPKSQRKNPGVDRIKIYSAKMGEYKWNGMTASPLNSNLYSVADPSLSPDGKRLYFASDMPGGYGGSDIYYCNREGAGWSKPVHLGSEINTAGRDVFPTADSLGNLYFASDGFGGFGGLDICVALKKGDDFDGAKLMKAPFNSSADDFGITFVKTGIAGYISSNRTGGAGDDDIYSFDLGKDSVNKMVTALYTVGYRPNQGLADVQVSIFDAKTQKPIEDGELSYRNPVTQQMEKVIFKKGVADIKVPGKTNLVMDISARGFKTRADSMKIPFVKNDTTINLVYNFGNPVIENSTEVTPTGTPKDGHKDSPMTMTFSTKNIFFDFDKYSIRRNEIAALDSVARYMKKNPNLTVEIGAHTDSKGTAEYNNHLSVQRADATLKYLSSKGIDKKRMKPIGYGFSKPFNKCVPGVECSDEQNQENRRVVFTFSK
jgi:outer membrane protein OmpA-like peptidoglycan-associated protein/tetratricopeptide (TPR) repeat protein